MRTEQIVLRTLGTARIDIGPVQVRPNAVRRFAALLYMSAEAGRRVPRRVLIDLLFPDQNERNGLHSLRELVYQLKAAGAALESDQEGVELRAGTVSSDYAEVLRAQRLTIEQIRGAQGGFLPGYAPHQSEAYKEWYEPFRAKVCSGLSRALLRDQEQATEVGNLELSEAASRACLVISPLNERAVKALAETMVLSGAKADALRLLDEYEAEVGDRSHELRLSAELMKRRIRERTADQYRPMGELPFAGRDGEMILLRNHFVQAMSGSGRSVLIIGDPGIGKTRLVTEFSAVAELDNTRIQRIRAHPNGIDRPMGLVMDLLPGLMQLPGALGVSPESMQALARVTENPGDGETGASLQDTAESVSRAITRALDDLISCISSEALLTIVIDDGHWADRLSLRLLFDLAARQTNRLLMLVTSRDRALATEAVWPDHESIIRLRPLDHDCVLQLSRRGLRGTTGETDEELQRWMAKIAQGNPLFLESLVAHFRETGEHFKVPSTLHELLERRLAALASNSLAVLQTCVLLGPLSSEKRLHDSLEMRFVDLMTALTELARLRLIDTDSESVLPAHPLIAEAVYATSHRAVQRLAHRRIAAQLEQEPDAHTSPLISWHCADHWAAAGEPERALANLRKCASHAYAIGRPADAADVLFKAASLNLSDTVRAHILREAVLAAWRAGEFDRVAEGVAVIRQLQPITVHDEVELAEFAALCVVFVDSSDFSNRVLSCLDSQDAEVTHRVHVGLAALKYADTYSVPSLAHAVAARITDSDLAAVNDYLRLEFRIVCHVALGEPERATAWARRLEELALRTEEIGADGALMNAGHSYWRAGLFDEAVAALEHAYEFAEKNGSIRRQLSSARVLAVILGDARKTEASNVWRARATAVRESTVRNLAEFETAAFELEFALTDKDILRAAELLAHADAKQLFSSPIRARWRRYFDARIRQISGRSPLTTSEIDAFLADTRDASSTSGIRDAEIGVLCVALTINGQREQAQNVLRDFLEWRRRYCRAALPLQLQHIISECRLADLLQSPSELGATCRSVPL